MTVGFGPQDVGRGYLAVLTIFTILEFFIAVIATHFGCQATRAQAHAVSASHRAPPPAPRPSPAKSAPLIHPGTQRRFRGKVFLVGGHGGAPASRDLLLFAPGRGALEGGLWGRGRSLSRMIGTLQKFTGQEKWASGRAARLGWAWTAVFPKLEDSVDREGMEEGPP